MQKTFKIGSRLVKVTLKWEVKKTIHNNWHIPLLYVAFGDSFLFMLLGFGLGVNIYKMEE